MKRSKETRDLIKKKSCSYSWCGRSLKTEKVTMPKKNFPIWGYLFTYEDAKIQLRKG
ncbi:hypothetical protein MGI18_19990 [Bacillus sp. OVS6]|nr:hypothetical protein MGI18_19990 [Bacillus sp. OVS6]